MDRDGDIGSGVASVGAAANHRSALRIERRNSCPARSERRTAAGLEDLRVRIPTSGRREVRVLAPNVVFDERGEAARPCAYFELNHGRLRAGGPWEGRGGGMGAILGLTFRLY